MSPGGSAGLSGGSYLARLYPTVLITSSRATHAAAASDATLRAKTVPATGSRGRS